MAPTRPPSGASRPRRRGPAERAADGGPGARRGDAPGRARRRARQLRPLRQPARALPDRAPEPRLQRRWLADQISGFTDRFFGAGGQAAGTYNAGTDGGYTGTGRAENALQIRARIKYIARALGLEPFRLNIQLQDGEPIPNIAGQRYGPALGLSALIATREHFTAGIAYNLATIPNPRDPALRERGIRGNAQALAAGVRWFDDDWYVGTVLARLRNHEATDEHNFFDGWGWEVCAQCRLGGRWWLTGGWNRLRPDGDQPLTGRYRVDYGVLGLRYALDGCDRVLYVNARGERSRDQDGTPADNMLTAGIRWGF